MNNRPIGVFDSGLGGLTCVKELIKILPNEDIIYFGDTGRVPYGSRSNEILLKYSRQDIGFLYQQNVKAIISACGTVSSVAGETLAKESPHPYLGVIIPSEETACRVTKNKRVGVIATNATLKSDAFAKEIHRIDPEIEVFYQGCPLFVPLVEEGHFTGDDRMVKWTVELYLSSLAQKGIDTLIMGCTHYPILESAIADFMGEDVTLINSGKEAALATMKILTEKEMLREDSRPAQYAFHVTDSADNFHRLATMFLDQPITNQVFKVSLDDLEKQ